ncbi:MAG: HEAT repeat domain-containing protein [Candidatus Thermoplasmatota archaeon]|nr:HEAT repeat domain-containing protein [Candidatus Thermoplasmatota archaeon]
MTMAGYPTHGGDVEWDTKDPAPPADEREIPKLREQVLNEEERMFRRMQALFALRAIKTEDAIDAIGEAMLQPESSLLRHEAAYILGQIADPYAIDVLDECLLTDDHPMVRHEAAEALGNINDDRVIPLLKRSLTEDEAVEVRESCEVALDNLNWLRDPDAFEPFDTPQAN